MCGVMCGLLLGSVRAGIHGLLVTRVGEGRLCGVVCGLLLGNVRACIHVLRVARVGRVVRVLGGGGRHGRGRQGAGGR